MCNCLKVKLVEGVHSCCLMIEIESSHCEPWLDVHDVFVAKILF